jgi:hypothetical protein
MLEGEAGAGDGGETDATIPRSPVASRVSPRMSLLLIGGAAIAGIVVMCLAVVALAIWHAS